jgi:hypothetical protein
MTELESEIGPLKYVAEVIYGNSETATVEHAVRLVILIIIFVFDPLAVLLLIGANAGLKDANIIVKAKRKKYKPRVKKDMTVHQHTVQDFFAPDK